MQRTATSLFTKVPTLADRDQHDSRIVLQVKSFWSDLSDEDRVWAFPRLNVYCIVDALGWPTATAACASSTATTDFVLPPEVVLLQQQQGQRRTRRDQQQPRPNQQLLQVKLNRTAEVTIDETNPGEAEVEFANKFKHFNVTLSLP